MVPLPDPGAPMMRVLALLPLERDLVRDTVTRDLLELLVNRLDSKVLVNILSGNILVESPLISHMSSSSNNIPISASRLKRERISVIF